MQSGAKVKVHELNPTTMHSWSLRVLCYRERTRGRPHSLGNSPTNADGALRDWPGSTEAQRVTWLAPGSIVP
jgi:hypothetical protein